MIGTGKDTKVIKQETTTNANGFYMFNNLPAGRYVVMETLQRGYVPVGSPVKNIMLAKGQNSMNNNFMNSPI